MNWNNRYPVVVSYSYGEFLNHGYRALLFSIGMLRQVCPFRPMSYIVLRQFELFNSINGLGLCQKVRQQGDVSDHPKYLKLLNNQT